MKLIVATYSFDSTLNLLSSLCAYTLQLVFPGLLKSPYKNWYFYSTTTTITTTTTAITATTNDKGNAYSGSGPVIKFVGQGREYKYQLRREDGYMQAYAPDW